MPASCVRGRVRGRTCLSCLFDDRRNRLAAWTGEGVAHAYGYDDLGNLTNHAGTVQTFDAPGRPHAVQTGASGATTYAHDADGNVTSIQEAGSTRYFQFDSANRLTCADTTPGGCALNRLHYDVDGFRVLDDSPASTRFIAFVDDSVRVDGWLALSTQIEIRAFGERIAYKASSDGYRLTSGRPAAPWGLPPGAWPALFGALALAGLLAWATQPGALVLERPGSAGVAAVLVGLLAIGPLPGPRVARAGGGGGASFYWELADPLGTGLVMLDETGARRVHRTYTPFGEPQASVGEADWLPRHYAGHLADEDSGLVYMQARWMDPQTGTFLSIDPLVPDAGDPQSYNGYSYTRNNPVSFTDPTGMCILGPMGGCLTVRIGESMVGGVLTITVTPITDTSSSGGLGYGSSGLGSLSSLEVGGSGTGGGLNGGGRAAGADSNPASQGGTGNPVVNSTFEALQHYFRGNGEPAELGPDVQDAIINSRDQQYRYDRIRTGRTPSLDRGVYGVDVELDGAYFVGDTPIEYQTLCRSGSCTTTFTSRGDGFWDVVRDVDRGGPRGELPGGTPYPFLPFSWQRTFPDPRSTGP
jgi:RHS repeat-associated protein